MIYFTESEQIFTDVLPEFIVFTFVKVAMSLYALLTELLIFFFIPDTKAVKMSAQFPCTKEDCTEVFTKKSQLKIHILLKHPETNEEETRKRKAIDIEIDNLAKKVAKTNESSSTTEEQNGGPNGHQNGSGQEKPFQMPTILVS